jgi:RNA polymerase sigma factor (sigma-70 family)
VITIQGKKMHMLANVSSTMESENDEALLLFMGMKDDDPNEARLAWAEFYKRHKKYLYAVCWKACQLLPDPKQTAMDLVSATFQKVYESADTFKPIDNGDEDHMRRRVCAWMGEIAQRLLIDDYRNNTDPKHLVSLGELDTELSSHREIPELSPKIALVRNALDILNEKERMVILLYYQWYEIGKENQRLPNGVCDEIAKTIGSTKENVRQIHRRAKQKIKEYLEQHVDLILRR